MAVAATHAKSIKRPTRATDTPLVNGGLLVRMADCVLVDKTTSPRAMVNLDATYSRQMRLIYNSMPFGCRMCQTQNGTGHALWYKPNSMCVRCMGELRRSQTSQPCVYIGCIRHRIEHKIPALMQMLATRRDDHSTSGDAWTYLVPVWTKYAHFVPSMFDGCSRL